jgi:hypothetical protein
MRARHALTVGLAVAALCTAPRPAADAAAVASAPTLDSLLERARRERWGALPIGERIARFGRALEGAPYVAGTLEGPGPEVVRVPMHGFDCVTFMELCLDLARVTAGTPQPAPTPQDVHDAVRFTRYRAGRLVDYTSRLHYTSEWIADNIRKGVVADVTDSLGGMPCGPRVGFMSSHPSSYPALVAHPAYVDSMRAIETAVARMPRTCIPRERIAAAESRLRTGDLVAIATSIEGLDYAHTGIIVRDSAGVARLLHASSKRGRVMLDVRLSDYVAAGPKSFTGVTIVRPVEVEPAPRDH